MGGNTYSDWGKVDETVEEVETSLDEAPVKVELHGTLAEPNDEIPE